MRSLTMQSSISVLQQIERKCFKRWILIASKRLKQLVWMFCFPNLFRHLNSENRSLSPSWVYAWRKAFQCHLVFIILHIPFKKLTDFNLANLRMTANSVFCIIWLFWRGLPFKLSKCFHLTAGGCFERETSKCSMLRPQVSTWAIQYHTSKNYFLCVLFPRPWGKARCQCLSIRK